MKKQIHLNGFAQNTVSPIAPGLWRYPGDQGHKHGNLSYWIEIAQLLEKGKFDSLFLADVYGFYSTYQNSYKPAVQHAAQSPLHDPLLIISAMANSTKFLGFAGTSSTTYAQPYMLARQFSTLDHITKGRVSWNIVTSYLDSEAHNLGLSEKIPHDERYDRADEFMEVVYKLWECSWADDAIVMNKETNMYADPQKIHAINHQGKYFHVPGPHISNPSPQRTPVLFQAGSSSKGRDFGAKHAEAVFTVQHTIEDMRKFSNDLRTRAVKAGRKRDSIRIFPLMVPIVGSTEEEAFVKYEELRQYVSYEGSVAILSGHLGIDLSMYDPDQYIEDMKTEGVQSVLNMYNRDSNKKWTIRDAVIHRGLGMDAVKFIGTPVQIADEMEKWMNEGDIDGFNIAQVTTPGTFRDFIQYVIPELQQRGIYRTEYEASTLRENMFGKGNARLPDNHPGRSYRVLS